MWTLALLAVAAYLVAPRADGRREIDRWRLAVLLPMMWLWNQLHGGFVYGYGYLGFVALGAAIDHFREHRTPFNQKSIALGALTYPTVFEKEYFTFVVELTPMNFRSNNGLQFELFLVVACLGGYLSRARLRFEDVVPAAIFLHLALAVQRGAVPLVVLTAPWVARMWTVVADKDGQEPGPDAPMRALRVVPVGAAFLALWGAWIAWSATPGVRGSLDFPGGQDEREATGAVRYLVAHPEAGGGGRIFNHYDAGGILEWALYPQRRVMIDGRGDFHSQGGTFVRYLSITLQTVGWEAMFDELDTSLAVLPSNAVLGRQLVNHHDWKVLFDDTHYAVLERPAGQTSLEPSSGPP